MFRRIAYWYRIIKAYLLPTTSQLSFWHGKPEINLIPDLNNPKPYYMKFHYKANYKGYFDNLGIPMLNYHGNIGLQYNPIAITQYGLGNYNLFLDNKEESRLKIFLNTADWLVKNLEPNSYGIPVWNHYFDFEYRDILKSPWYSGLAQGLGISLLSRAYMHTNQQKYLEACEQAWISFTKPTKSGGVMYWDPDNDPWIEEYIVSPPTHILNGFIWALWGIYDMWKILKNENAKKLFFSCCKTLEKNISIYDNNYWSLYEQSGTFLSMLASPFYHNLHIAQLKILSKISNKNIFQIYSDKWNLYNSSNINKYRALLNKSIFKIFYY